MTNAEWTEALIEAWLDDAKGHIEAMELPEAIQCLAQAGKLAFENGEHKRCSVIAAAIFAASRAQRRIENEREHREETRDEYKRSRFED